MKCVEAKNGNLRKIDVYFFTTCLCLMCSLLILLVFVP